MDRIHDGHSKVSYAITVVVAGQRSIRSTRHAQRAGDFGRLGCDACEAEAAQALRGEGWTDAEIKHLLTFLTSEKLDAFELRVLRFARETVRYQTRRLQELAQGLATGLERDVLLEIIGLVAYANGLARISILLHQC
jgi:alkylhydroperoxidase family enzyme